MAFVIPTIFRAVDQFSPTVAKMGTTLSGFERSLNIAGATSERNFRKMTNVFSRTSDQMFLYAKSALAVGATIGGIVFSAKSLMDYEDELANLRSLTGATGAEFQKFKGIIHSVAVDTKTSAVDVAKSFTTIANAMPELLENAEGLGKMTTASILLAKAARMELQPAASALTDILNQFNKGADDAAKTVDILAAASKYGSAEITDLQAAMIGFGKLADVGNINIREAASLVELVSKFKRGTDAGIELRNVLIEMSKNTAQDPTAQKDLRRLGVNMSLLADKTKPLSERLLELKKIAGDSNALFHVFGKENVIMGTMVAQNADKFADLASQLDETGNAMRMANENTHTLKYALKQLSASWVNIITGSDGANKTVSAFTNTIIWLGDNLGTIANIAGLVATAFIAWWTINKVIWAVRGAMFAYNAVLGINTVLQGQSLVALGLNEGALYGYSTAANVAAFATNTLGVSLKSMIASLGIVTAGLSLIYAYRKEITGFANDNAAGMAYNYAIGDYQAVKQSLERKYITDPSATRKFVNDNPKYNSPAIQSAFGNIDSGTGNNDDADALMQEKILKIQMLKGQNVPLNETNQQTIMHNFTIKLEDSSGRTLKVINSADMKPELSSTSNYGN